MISDLYSAFMILFWIVSSGLCFRLAPGDYYVLRSMSHAERDNAISQYCRVLCTYGRSRGFARRNGVPCDLWQFCLRLSFHLGGAAVVVSSLIGTIVSIRIYIARGFDPRVGFPLVRCF